MNPLAPLDRPEGATAFYRDGPSMRSRSVSSVVLSGTVDVPPPTSRLLTDWEREITHNLALEPGDVESLPLPRARLRYLPPDPKLVDLSFAGRLKSGDPSLAAIAAASPGDAVHLIRDGDRWRIDNARGETLTRLSRAFAPPEATTFLRGEVAAILNWRREDGDEEYNHLLRRDEWEVVLPELVFEAGAHAVTAD